MTKLNNYVFQEGDKTMCLHCKQEFFIETDLLVCEDCMDLFDTDKLWALHDSNKLDALDFNESLSFRKRFLK